MDTCRGSSPPPRQQPPVQPKMGYWQAITTAGGFVLATTLLVAAITVPALLTFQLLVILATFLLLGDIWFRTPLKVSGKVIATSAAVVWSGGFYHQFKPHKVSLDYKVAISCSHFGDSIPFDANRKTHLLVVWGAWRYPFFQKGFRVYGAQGILQISSGFMTPPGSSALTVLKCTFTNFSNIPLLNAQAQLGITWLDNVGTPYVDEVSQETGDLGVGSLGSASDQSESVYIVNYGTSAIIIEKPITLKVTRAGETKSETVKVSQSEPVADTSLSPPSGPYTNPPVEPAPYPAPPQQP